MYGSLSGADTYHSERGNSGWVGTNAEKLASMIVGSEVLDGSYGINFIGSPIPGNVDAWPRMGAVDYYGNPVDGIPVAIEYASYELALRERMAPGSLRRDFTVSTSSVKKKKVGPIEIEYGETKATDFRSSQPVVPTVEYLLWRYLIQRGMPSVFVV